FHTADEPRSLALEYQPLFDTSLLLLTAADHPLAHKRRIGPEDLAGQPLILAPAVNSLRRSQDRLLRQVRLTDRSHIVLETEHTHIVLQYVALGLGITFWLLPPWAVERVPGLHGRVLDPGQEPISVSLVIRKHARLAEHVQTFCQLVHPSFT